MEPYKYYKAREEEAIKNFFSQPKPLQRLAFTGRNDVPSSSFDCVVVTDDFALIETGNIIPTRGLHGIFPGKRITFRWHYSNDSKKCKAVSTGVKYEIKRILSETDRYNFVEHVPVDCLCSSVLRDILYGKITNPHDAITAYGKKLGVKHLNNEVFKLSSKLNFSPTVILAVINPAQLKTCFELLYQRIDDDYAYQRMFRDMLEQAYALEEHINLMWSDKRMDEVHTDWSQKLMLLEMGDKSHEPIWSDEIVQTFANHNLELINTEARCFEEGYVMRHCCYTNYWRHIHRKKYLLFRVHGLTGRFVTLGMRLSATNDGVEFTIEQAHGKRNARVFDYEMEDIKNRLDQPDVVETLQWMAGVAAAETSKKKASTIEPFDWGQYEQGELPW